ncbi:hypothetical protein [Acidiferrobacter sp.]|uniref:hypothetical protein n=1 Tax=Acidiferrobacter sp. TaxID=1872107 RepID=UPI0026351BAC|nr:hypothetical protein [Acidiferrobacter sp.]
MPRKPMYKTGPMSAAERMREKRARDQGLVWGSGDDLGALSDSGLIEQLAIAFRRDREKKARGVKKEDRGAVTRWLLKEVVRRI